MELKLKEGVKVNSTTFKKQVEDEVREFLDEKNNYTVNDIHFYTMIVFLDVLSEGNLLLNTLSDDEELLDNMFNNVEPLFEDTVINNKEYYEIYMDIVKDLTEYMDRLVLNKRSVASMLYDLKDFVLNLDIEDIKKLYGLIQENMIKELNKTKNIGSKNKPEKLNEQFNDIGFKMEELINQYSNQKKDTNK